MLEHKEDFMPFVPSVNGEDAFGATDDGVMTEKDFKKYCKLVAETGEWGGEPEVGAPHETPSHDVAHSNRYKPSRGRSTYPFMSFSEVHRQSSHMAGRTIRLAAH